MKNTMFIPVVPKYLDELQSIMGYKENVSKMGYSVGFMLYLIDGIKGLDQLSKKYYGNLEKFVSVYGNIPIVTMLSNMPFEDIDFLHEPANSIKYVKKGIDFVEILPIGSRRILTFHLNTLSTVDEFYERSRDQWIDIFLRKIVPSLSEISNYASDKNVEVKIETTPVPEFGDIGFDDPRFYRGVRLNQLRNPFYLTSYWGFAELRKIGLGICLDLCHNRTIYMAARSIEASNIIHVEDIKILKKLSLIDDVKCLESSDLVHLNDGLGLFSKKLKTIFQEGIALGRGDIPNLVEIIKEIHKRRIPFVLEVDKDGDYKNRPDTKTSIDYISKII